MTHLWVRHEPRDHERRVGVTPDGVAQLLAGGLRVTVEDDPFRAIPTEDYRRAGATIAPAGTWSEAPQDAIIFGLKELVDDATPLHHRHIMFGHAYKGQPDGRRLLARFRKGGGRLLDLEYLVDDTGRRVAAFGYWAGFAGAAASLIAFGAQKAGGLCPPLGEVADPEALVADVANALKGDRPSVLIIGALGRVGRGAADMVDRLGLPLTRWDKEETANGGPFPAILDHDVFLNCILAGPGVPVFVPAEATHTPRRLGVIGDIACDPDSAFSPVKVYDRTTTWEAPVIRVADAPPMDVMAIDNLPSMLPRQSSEDFAAQLLPHLATLSDPDSAVWRRAAEIFDQHV